MLSRLPTYLGSYLGNLEVSEPLSSLLCMLCSHRAHPPTLLHPLIMQICQAFVWVALLGGITFQTLDPDLRLIGDFDYLEQLVRHNAARYA